MEKAPHSAVATGGLEGALHRGPQAQEHDQQTINWTIKKLQLIKMWTETSLSHYYLSVLNLLLFVANIVIIFYLRARAMSRWTDQQRYIPSSGNKENTARYLK